MASEQPVAPQPSEGGLPSPQGSLHGSPFPSWGTKRKKKDLSLQSEPYVRGVQGDEPSVDGHTHPDDGLAKLAGVGTKQEEPADQTPGACNLPKSEPLDHFAGRSLHLTAALALPHQDLLPDTPPPARVGTSPAQAAGPNQRLPSPKQEPAPPLPQALPCPAAPTPTAKAAAAAVAAAAAAAAANGEIALAAEAGGGEGASGSAHLPSGLHHLTRHWLPEAMRGQCVLHQLGAADLKAAESMIKGMGQRDLRQAFQRVYSCETQSYNNNWLRRKLMEAVGLKATPSPRHARGGPTAVPAARPRPARPPAPRRPAPAAAAGAGAPAPSFGAEISKKVTRKAAVAAAEADAVAALRTMMAGGMEGDSSWGGGGSGSLGEEAGEEGAGEEPSLLAEELACEEGEPGGQQPGRQQQQQQQRQRRRQQQQEESPPSPTARWKAALSRAGSGSGGPGGSGGVGDSVHQAQERRGPLLKEGMSTCREEGMGEGANNGSGSGAGSVNGAEANGSVAAPAGTSPVGPC